MFLTTVILGLTLIHVKKYQHLLLLLASYFFFYISSNIFILLLFVASLSSYYLGIAIFRAKDTKNKKIWLLLACTILLGTLGYFKYINFAATSLNYLLASLNIVPPFSELAILLPIGISFYTFEALIYVVDIYRGRILPADSMQDYLLYMAFFPKLIAGPIVRAWEFLPQLKKGLEFNPQKAQFGVTLIVWGLFKKVVIADNLGKFADLVFADPIGNALTSFDVWAGTFAFGLQIFCDFSGYTDIAIGTALIIGISLPQNFNRPYFSPNPTEFWRNWHITLSRIVRDYVYIPLGGNRKGRLRSYLNLLVAWMLSGLWHGAAWNFVLWGAFHGGLLSAHRFFRERAGLAERIPSGYPTIFLSIIVTQFLVFLGWIFFRVRDVHQIAYCLNKYLIPDLILSGTELMIVSCVLGLVIGIYFMLKTRIGMRSARKIWNFDHIAYISSRRYRYWILCLAGIGLVIVAFGPDAAPQFLYMRF
ncbi:MAG: hypothetical protein LUQ25_05555 [Methanoregulaceae archaeon]|nr:hypothetical protein [Methanoregulaceae archaeon]